MKTHDIRELNTELRGIDHREVFVSVLPYTVETARWASHDTRIDSIVMTTDNIRVFDKRQVSVMKYYSKPLELWLPDLLNPDHGLREAIYRRVNLFTRNKIPLLIGSLAEKWSDLYPPISIIKILTTLYDVPEKHVLLSISDIPNKIISNKGI